jgi:magnesium-transporting ATPase (P-type)
VIETLGVVSLICTDKSGTLTENQMTVREVWAGRQRFTLSGVGYEPKGRYSPSPAETPAADDLMMLLTAAELCNNSRLIAPSAENPLWSGLGDQTEVALRVSAYKAQVDVAALGALFPRIHELPFDARRKRMSTIHRDLSGQVAFVKGAPREVLQLCTSILLHGEICPLDETLRAEILAANDDYARGALRVLALARRDLPPRSGSYSVEGVERELTFLGLMAMMDPPRPEVEQAVQTLRQAGINLVMITGDYGLTAVSLARRVGMIAGAEPLILTGAELDELDDNELDDLLERKEIVFARMAPEHKLRLVAAYQQRGEVVAVTGDGVNDAPALRKADVGVVMGLVGTDVAKEAADVILTTDNFSTITAAIEEGRAVFANLRKFITYIFSSNVPEVAPFLLTGLFGLPLALNAKQVLAVDLGTDLLPALALGTEKPEPDVMLHPPRSRRQPLIDRSLLARSLFWLGPIETILCYLGFFAVYYFEGAIGLPDLALERLGALPALLRAAPANTHLLAGTVFHAGVVLAQVGNAFACRSETNRGRALGWASNQALLSAAAIEVGLILVMIYVPPINGFFDHLALPGAYWALLAVYPLVLYSLEWIRKGLSRKISANGNGKSNGVLMQQANQTGRGES